MWMNVSWATHIVKLRRLGAALCGGHPNSPEQPKRASGHAKGTAGHGAKLVRAPVAQPLAYEVRLPPNVTCERAGWSPATVALSHDAMPIRLFLRDIEINLIGDAGRIINDDPRTFIERVKILAGPRLATISVEIDTLSPQRVDPPVPALGIPY
jgi:hypothetical protein